MKKSKTSIRVKLMITFTILVSIPVVVLGVLSYRTVSEETFRSIEQQLGQRSLKLIRN